MDSQDLSLSSFDAPEVTAAPFIKAAPPDVTT